MGKRSILIVFAFFYCVISTPCYSAGGAKCTGHFVNPITDICWSCLFPLTIGNAAIVPGDKPDTDNPASPICICPSPTVVRVGINFGYWEPFALADVTRSPFCLVNLGGVKLHIKNMGNMIGAKRDISNNADSSAFYWVHWYKYPLMYWLNLLTNYGCLETGDMDIAYMTELDPMWHDDELSFIINPEAILFGSAPAQTACVADSMKTTLGNSMPIDALFWCLGGQGSAYPLDGSVAAQVSPIQAATQMVERMDFKLHREALVWDSTSLYTCTLMPMPILPKSHYRYQMVNTVPAANHCYPFGTNTEVWEAGHEGISGAMNYGFLIWRKRNCCFL